jgi:hypothetical protein
MQSEFRGATEPHEFQSSLCIVVHSYIMASRGTIKSLEVERVQTGIRIEQRILKVLKATAELKGMSLGGLLEGIVLYAFEAKSAFSARPSNKLGNSAQSADSRSGRLTAII